MSDGTLDPLLLVAFLLLTAGFIYLYVAGVLHRERPLSRIAALAALASGLFAAVFLMRLVL